MANQNLSLIPYASDRNQIVLRHGSAVVLYDERLKQISLRQSEELADAESSTCPLCGKLFDQPESEGNVDAENPALPSPTAGFVNPGYFRMLHSSRAASRRPSRATSPQLRLEPLDTDLSSEIHGRSVPDVNIESTPYSQKISPEAFSQNYFKTFFAEERELGRGGRGVVLLVRHVIDGVDLGTFACKRVPVGNDSEWLRRVLVEVQLLQTLSHTNLVSYRHVWLENIQINNFSPAVPCAFILQQYCNAGDLHQYIFGANQTFSTEELKNRIRTRSKGEMETPENFRGPRRLHFEEIFSFFRDITAGLNYLHRKNYIHRDLKPSNCLLHRTGPHIRVLVSDFGEMQGADTIRKSTGSTGTISFCAPEVLRETSPGVFGNFSQKSDIFSLGLIVYLMCFGRLPYASADTAAEENEDIDQLKEEISAWRGVDVEYRNRSDLPERLYKSLKLLLALEPSERPGTEDILTSIKAGSALHEQGQGWPPGGAALKEYDNHVSEKEQGGAGGVAVPAINDNRRRPSALVRAGTSSEVTESQRRASSPRTTLQHQHPARVVGDVMKRRMSADVGMKQNLQAGQGQLGLGLGLGEGQCQQRLIKAPGGRRWMEQAWEAMQTRAGRTALFCFKLVTCIRPCSPLAVRAWLSYPLLLLAMVGWTLNVGGSAGGRERGRGRGSGRGIGINNLGQGCGGAVLLLAVHVAVIAGAQWLGCLCENPGSGSGSGSSSDGGGGSGSGGGSGGGSLQYSVVL